MILTCLLPAAGAASRMRGGDKLLELVDGAPCLAVMVKRARAAGLEVVVTVPRPDHPRVAALDGLGAHVIVVRDAATGMSASLRAGARAVPVLSSGLMILPPDMPALETSDLALLKVEHSAYPNAIVQATTSDNTPGHPVVFPKHLLGEFENLTGDRGAARLIQKHQSIVQFIPLKGQRARLDLDTPEAWHAWRASKR